jgi:hypothetical protein
MQKLSDFGLLYPRILVIEARAALARGTKHYSIHGTPLTTVKEIIQALRDDRGLLFDPARRSKHES